MYGNLNRKALYPVIIASALTGGVVNAEVGTEIDRCPITLSGAGSYYLSDNLYTETGTCITVGANHVTLDLKGFMILRGVRRPTHKIPDTDPGHGIYINNQDNVEIRNGSVIGFGCSGIREHSITARNHRVIGVRVIHNGRAREGCSDEYVQAGISLTGNNHLVKDSTVAENGSSGIWLGNGVVASNMVSTNEGSGIDVGSGSAVTDNHVEDNWWTGIVGTEGTRVTGNVVVKNHSKGIDLGGQSIVSGNLVHNNLWQGMVTGQRSTVSGNTVVGNGENGGSGIAAEHGSTVTGNTVADNHWDGISAGNGSTVVGNTVINNNLDDTIEDGGITVVYGSTVRGNTARKNRQNNILASGSANTLEENLVSESLNGIHMPDGNNFYARNRASGHTTHYTNPAVNISGGGNLSTP